MTPIPMTDSERLNEAATDRLAMFAGQPPLTRPLTLKEAFSRALAYNLDARVRAMEAAVALDDLDLANLDMLPKVAINAAAVTRSNVEASSSTSILTGRQSLEPSTSTDRSRVFGDLTLSWNVLDFGISYYNARQQSNRLLIAEERRRKVYQSLLQDVRQAFWRAAAAERLSGKVGDSIRAAESALADARKVETQGLRPPIDALRYQKALLDLLRQLESVQLVLETSKTDLGSLINLPPGTRYRIATPGPRAMHLSPLPAPIRQMERTALLLNPDIRELSYEQRISAAESRKAILRLLPSLNLNVGPRYDSNSFLVNNQWVAGAAYLNGYLNSLITAPTVIRRAENAEALTDIRREAISMAVLTRLHIAVGQYAAASKEFKRATQLSDVDQRLYQQITNRVETDAQGDLERVSAQVSALYSELRSYQSFAEAQSAIGRLYAALGFDDVPNTTEVLSVMGMNEAVQLALKQRQRNVPPDPSPQPAQSPAADSLANEAVARPAAGTTTLASAGGPDASAAAQPPAN